MSENEQMLNIEYLPTGKNSRVILTVRSGEEVVANENMDITKSKARKEFADNLSQRYAGIDSKQIEDKLLAIAGEVADKLAKKEAGTSSGMSSEGEIDVRRIIRPERFITTEVSGLSVPIATACLGKPSAEWRLYVQWADGKRKCVPLDKMIALADGGQLWIHPEPTAPSLRAPAWSQESRRLWLDGGPVPDVATVLKSLCERIEYFIEFPDEQATGATAVLALWIVLTYVYQAWDAVPYLYLGGPVGSGKSQVLDVLSRLVFRPTSSSNMTAASLFRTLHGRGGTLLLDEAERLKHGGPEAAEILTMLLAGYKRGGRATRLEKVGDSYETVEFDVYGPKALACIAGLPIALASRCISIFMFRAAKGSPKPMRLMDEEPGRWQQLRDDLHVMVLAHGETFLSLPGHKDVCPAMITGRRFQLWQPIMALAAWVESSGAEGLLKLVQEYAKTVIDFGQEEETPMQDEIVLRTLADLLSKGQSPIAKEVLAQIKEDEPGTFDGYGPKWISSQLGRYGIRTRKSGGRKIYGSEVLQKLRNVQQNYGMDLGLDAGSADAGVIRAENVPHVPHVPQNCSLVLETGVGEGT